MQKTRGDEAKTSADVFAPRRESNLNVPRPTNSPFPRKGGAVANGDRFALLDFERIRVAFDGVVFAVNFEIGNRNDIGMIGMAFVGSSRRVV